MVTSGERVGDEIGDAVSHSVTILLREPGVEEVVSTLGRSMRSGFQRFDGESNPFGTVFLDTDIRVFSANFEDDQGLSLSQYRTAVDLEFPSDILDHSQRKRWLSALALLLAAFLHKRCNWESVVLEDIQVLLARYPSPDP
jgi:hypothetical protein